MKKHKTWKTVVLLCLAAFFIIGPLSNFKDGIVFNIIGLIIGILILAGVVLSWLSRNGINVMPVAKKEKTKKSAVDEVFADVSDLDTGDDFEPTWKYEYTNVGLFRPKDVTTPMPPVGEYVGLMPEPENPYDSGAVKAVYGGETVGYMNRGKLQDMIRDKYANDAAICAKVTRADDKLEIWIGVD